MQNTLSQYSGRDSQSSCSEKLPNVVTILSQVTLWCHVMPNNRGV